MRRVVISAVFLMVGMVNLSVAPSTVRQVVAQDSTTASAEERPFLFDDFNYETADDPTLTDNGWVVRTADGWPGVPGAVWRKDNVTFVDDADEEGNRLMQMTSSTDGVDAYQTQVCQQRKFLEGTFATRVRFSDTPSVGPDGDNVVQTFYLISPQKFAMDPDYSELDFEYLPNGGWGNPHNSLASTTWETFQLDPWIADNASDATDESFDGWHTLVLQIGNGEAHYFVDGKAFASHSGKYYPEVMMSINYNLWFIDGGQISSAKSRDYVEQADWMYFSQDSTLTPEQVEANVAALRADKVAFNDSVPAPDPVLDTPCNF